MRCIHRIVIWFNDEGQVDTTVPNFSESFRIIILIQHPNRSKAKNYLQIFSCAESEIVLAFFLKKKRKKSAKLWIEMSQNYCFSSIELNSDGVENRVRIMGL